MKIRKPQPDPLTKGLQDLSALPGKRSRTISERGYWTTRSKRENYHDEGLAQYLCGAIYPHESVLDLGCGDAYYIRKLAATGSRRYSAYDGNPHTQEMSLGYGAVVDLTKPLMLAKHDWVLSLEVAEHIPAEFESVYLTNLSFHAEKGVIISWARPGQHGRGHVNCRPQDYVIERFGVLGFYLNEHITNSIRTVCTKSWFKKNLLVFQRDPFHS